MPEQYALQALFGPGRPELQGHIPHGMRLGITVVDTAPCTARLKLPYREELIGDPVRRIVFGGAITTLLDQASGLAVGCSVAELKPIATLDLRIDYLRAARPGADLIGEARCYKLTQHIAFVRGIAYEDTADDPFAHCIATFMVGTTSATSEVKP